MNPKDGKAGNAVEPAEPAEAYDADDADPGKVEEAKTAQAQAKTGKYGSTATKPHKPPGEQEQLDETTTKTAWIEIELIDEADAPVPGESYQITLPNGFIASGTLDGKGFARVDGIEPGTCKVTFPNLDKDAWGVK